MDTVQIVKENAAKFRKYFPNVNMGIIDEPGVVGIGILDGEKSCGAILATGDDDAKTASLDVFYIDKEYRGRGLGSELLSALSDRLKAQGMVFLEAHLLHPFDNAGESYLLRNGFSFEEPEAGEYIVFPDSLRHFVRNEILEESGRFYRVGNKYEIRSIDSLSDSELSELQRGPASGFMETGASAWEAVKGELSFSLWDGDTPLGVILMTRYSRKIFSIGWYLSESGIPIDNSVLLFRALTELALIIHDDGYLRFFAVSEISQRMVESIRRMPGYEDAFIRADAVRVYKYL